MARIVKTIDDCLIMIIFAVMHHRFGLLFAFYGIIISILLVILLGNDYSLFLIAAPLSAYLTGTILWRLIVNKSDSGIRMATAGIAAGLISHYPCWVFTGIGFLLCYHLTGS